MMVDVGLDTGAAWTKLAMFDEQGLIVNRSHASLLTEGVANIGMGGASGITYKCGYETFTVNKVKNRSLSTQFPEYPFSEMNSVLSSHALIEAGLSGKTVNIATGLPLSQFYSMGEGINQENRQKKIKSIERVVTYLDLQDGQYKKVSNQYREKVYLS